MTTMALPKMVEVEVYGGSGGTTKDGVPVRPGRYESNLGYVLNGEHLLMCEDLANTDWHRNGGTWARVLKTDGTLLFPSPNNENWMERQGHLRVVEPAPVPVPPPAETGVTPAQAGEALGTLVAFVRQVWG